MPIYYTLYQGYQIWYCGNPGTAIPLTRLLLLGASANTLSPTPAATPVSAATPKVAPPRPRRRHTPSWFRPLCRWEGPRHKGGRTLALFSLAIGGPSPPPIKP